MKRTIDIQICKNHLTNDDSYYGQVFKGGMRTKESIIEMIVGSRTELRGTTILASSNMFDNKTMERLLQGETVSYGFFRLFLSVNGKFRRGSKWNPESNHFELCVEPTDEFRELLQTTKGKIINLPDTNMFLYSAFDTSTDTVNKNITPGCVVEINGKTIKIAGDDPSTGVFLQNIETEEEVKIPQNNIIVNHPKRLLILSPKTLAHGSYRIIIRTQYTVGSKLTKVVKTCRSPFVLDASPTEG